MKTKKNSYPPGNGYISHLGKFGKSSTQNAIFGGYVSSLEGILSIIVVVS